MADQLLIGNFSKGLKNDRTAFNIDNDAFPYMSNFYIWRGRVKRKRGTQFLGQLARQIEIVMSPTEPWEYTSINLSSGAANIITGFDLETTATLAATTIDLTIGGETYTDPNSDGTLMGSSGGTGTINYATGDITITGGGVSAITGTFSYYPGIPVMGLRDYVKPAANSATINPLYPLLLAFDTTYSYQANQGNVPIFYSTSYYKNSEVPVIWNGQDYQQFWTCNYSAAFWATNGNAGLHIVQVEYLFGSGTTMIQFFIQSMSADFTTLVDGDMLWFNEWTGGSTINGITGTVSDDSGASSGLYTITFPQTVTVSGTGIAQLLTNTIPGQDGIRWYDGDPTSATGIPTGTGLGWVNFAPPLTATTVVIENHPFALYYLVGALAILPFKDRLLFYAPIISTSNGPPIQLIDVILWSWNGTPYYTAPVPNTQTSDPTAYYIDQAGKGGYLSAGIAQPISTISTNEDVQIIGFGGDGRKTRFVYSGNDLQPFLFFTINSELPSSATFSAITMDRGVLDIGQYGLALTDQQSSRRIDIEIPDEIFQIQDLNFGAQRVTAMRDFYREWIYFTYPYNDSTWKFPTRTLLFNYRDNTWGFFYENWTCYGHYRPQMKKSWLTLPYLSWDTWRAPWNSGINSPLVTNIIVGNPQGYVLIRDDDSTSEGQSGTIAAISSSGGLTEITSPNHCLEVGDYIYITGCIGSTYLNNVIAQVANTGAASSPTTDTFFIDKAFQAGTYLGLGQYTRLSQPFIQTKQFPFYWEQGRQIRLSAQKYLLEKTAASQITVNIYLSQDSNDAFNNSYFSEPTNALIYSQLLYTCPEASNIGLTEFNTNLQMPTAESQSQIWHRYNTSLIGNSVQLGFTLNDSQMRDLLFATDEINIHAIQLTVSPGPLLA